MSSRQSDRIPPNSLRLFLPIELLTIINAKSGLDSQLSATWILKQLTLLLKDDIVKAHGQESFDNLMAKYSLSAVEQTKNNQIKRKTRQEARQKRFDFQQKKYEQREKELDIRQRNTDNRTENKQDFEQRNNAKYKCCGCDFFTDNEDEYKQHQKQTNHQIRIKKE